MSGKHIAGRETSFDKIHILEDHAHKEQKCYPTGAAGVVVTGAAGAWTLGSFAEIVPASTITNDFDVHWVNVENISASGVYELVLYDTTTEICRTRFNVLGTPANIIVPAIRVQTPIVKASQQIQAKVMNAAGGSETVTISIEYHEY